MSDRRIYINERVHTGEITQHGLKVLGMDIDVLRVFKNGVEDMNPALDPAPEPEIIRRIFQPDTVPDDLRGEWKRRERALNLALNEAGIQTYPEMLWGIIYRRVPHARELPTADAALQFLQMTEDRLNFLYRPAARAALMSLPWARLVAMENMVLRSAVHSSTFFRPVSPLVFGLN